VLRERQRQLELPPFNVAIFKNQEPLRNYYQLLALDASASAEDVKKAFRREIAKYHPDKVQHLGQEFQAMAAALAADLTEAHRILMDPALRATYDDELRAGQGAPEPPPLHWATTPLPYQPGTRPAPSPPPRDRPTTPPSAASAPDHNPPSCCKYPPVPHTPEHSWHLRQSLFGNSRSLS